jgi:FMN phosphatase YigB (HAD superfamily)
MRCSNCSAPLRPIVAVDIDGTLGDYHQHFCRFVTAYIGETDGWWADKYGGAVPFKTWVTNQTLIDERTYRDIKLAYRQGAQKRSMPVYQDARPFIDALKGAGVEVWLTTTRPYMRLDGIDPDTRAWLERHGIEYDHLLYDKKKYVELAARVDPERVVAVVDDLDYLISQAEGVLGNDIGIMRSTEWNRYTSAPYEVEELMQALDIIYPRLEAWRTRHER